MTRKNLFAVTTLVACLLGVTACGDIEPADEALQDQTVDRGEAISGDGTADDGVTDDGAVEDGVGAGDEALAGDGEDPLDPPADPFVGAGPNAPVFPAYIVYLQPVQGSNLDLAVRTFIANHDGRNLAASFPPHVSVTGFFQPTPFLTRSQLRARFLQAITEAGGTPFGQPTITGVVCNLGKRLVELKVKIPSTPRVQFIEPGGIGRVSRFFRFSTEVTRLLGAKGSRKRLRGYHVTLFQAASPKTFPKATFKSYCAQAHARFDNLAYANNAWEVALYFAPTRPTASSPLSDVVIAVRVTP